MKIVAWVMMMVAVGAGVACAQVSADEAMKRLQEKQRQRQAERNEMVTIRRGELDDLRAEVARLRTELAALRQQSTTEPSTLIDAPPRFVLKVTKGVTRQQLVTFLAQHKAQYRIAKDVRSPDKQELLTIERFKMEKVLQGVSTNGVTKFRDYKDERKVVATWELVLIDDVIAEISGDPTVIE